MSALLPCPFCNGPAEVDSYDGRSGTFVQCANCAAQLPSSSDWNARTQPDPDPLLEQLVGVLREVFLNLAAIGHPVDSEGRYHKDGEWTFADALPNPADGEELLNAFNIIKSALSAYDARRKA